MLRRFSELLILMKPLDEKLHKSIHNKMLNQNYSTFLTNPRLRLFRFFERKFGNINGTVLDVGAGSGYASIYLALKHSVKKVLALESSLVATSELIPKNVEHYKVAEKVFPLLGSFSEFKIDEKADFVFSFGSLHHSDCLFSTFKALGRNMKSGSYLLAQEPAMPDFTTNLDYQKKYDCIEKKFGVEIRNGDRDDHFFRVSEYITAAQFCGMDLLYSGEVYSLQSKIQKIKEIFKLWINKVEVDKISFHTRRVIPKVFVFRKHKKSTPIAHLWKPLR